MFNKTTYFAIIDDGGRYIDHRCIFWDGKKYQYKSFADYHNMIYLYTQEEGLKMVSYLNNLMLKTKFQKKFNLTEITI